MGGSDQSGQAARSSTAHAQAAVSTAVAGGAAFKPPSAPRKGMLSTFEKYPGARLHEQRNACSSLQTVTHVNEQRGADKRHCWQGSIATTSSAITAEHVHDPETAKAEARAAARKHHSNALAAHAGGAWKPAGQVKSDATRSIVRMNM
jgi:hypothetical protein